MRKIKQEVSIYTYGELSDNSKMKAREDYLKDYPLYEDLSGYGEQLLLDTYPNAEYETISYDLSNSQGSGSVVEFKYSNLRVFLQDFPFIKEFLGKKYNLNEVEFDEIEFEFICESDLRYSIPKYNYIINRYDYDDFTTDLDEFLYQQLSDSRSTLREGLSSFQRDFTEMCYNYYENLGTQEELYDEMWFYVDGSFAGYEDDFEENQHGN